SAGRARVNESEIEAQGFEILEAALLAWNDVDDAVLAGYIAYDLAAELEDLGDCPADDSGLPSMYFVLYSSTSSVVSFAADPIAASGIGSRPDQAEYEASVANIVRSIYAGDIFQTNLCRRIETQLTSGTAWDLYQRLIAESPARYAAFIQMSREQ